MGVFSNIVALIICAVLTVTSSLAQANSWSEKVPQSVIDAITSGHPQDIIVLFDDTAVQKMATTMRENIGTPYDNQEITNFKAKMYSSLKKNVISTFPEGELDILTDYSHLPMMFVRINSLSSMQQLTDRPEVVRVYENEKKYHMLASTLPFIRQPQVAALGMVGTGTTVAVLDNGIDLTQSAFGTCTSPVPGFCSDTNPPAAPAGCKISCTRDFDNGTDHNHGSNVSGIVLGVAPDTRIAALNVFRNDGYAYSDRIIQAINWCITNKTAYNIVAMNLSLGGGGSTSPCTGDTFANPVNQARLAGILAAIASGNNAYANMISSPACVPAAVSVGAVYDLNYGVQNWSACTDSTSAPDKVICFSNSAYFLTMLAPGAHVDAAGRSNYSGTSMATPHIAGSIAVIKGANAFPGDTPNQVVTRMTSTGVLDTDAKSGVTTPRIDLLSAVGGGGCSYSLAPTSESFPASGGTGSVSVTTQSGCNWTATSNASWITITSGSSGTGNGTVTYSVEANTLAASRTGTITIADKTFTVNQAGTSANPLVPDIKINGSDGPLNVSSSTPLNITISLDAGDFTNVEVDAWLCGYVHNIDIWYCLDPSLQPIADPDIVPVAQGHPYSFGPTQVYTLTIPGGYTVDFYFAIDLTMDGKFDFSGLFYYDVVQVTAGAQSQQDTYSISGTVTSGGSPLSGVTITLSGAGTGTTTTDSQGNYTFTGLANGIYVVKPSASSSSPTNRVVTVNGSDVTGQDFTVTYTTTYSISGTVTSGGSPLSGVTMTLSGAGTGTTTTDSSGNYSFSGLSNGSYTVTPSKTGYTFTPTSRNVNISGANVIGQDFTGTPPAIGITVTVPNGSETWPPGTTQTIRWTYTGDPGANVKIELLKNGVLNRTITKSTPIGSGGNGSYNWSILSTQTLGTDYRIKIVSTTISTYTDTSDNDFTIGTTVTYSISGTVTSGGSPLSGVTMTLSGDAARTTTTDSSGNYSFTNLANGSYTVTPSRTSCLFTPSSRSVTISGADVTGQNFTSSKCK